MFSVILKEPVTRKFLDTTLKRELKPRDFCVYPRISLWRNSLTLRKEPCVLTSAPHPHPSVALVHLNRLFL